MIKAINYYGSKGLMLKKIIPFLNLSHETYVEVFGGSAIILLNKPYSKNEIYNDLNSDLVNFFRVIRKKTSLSKFQDLVKNIPASREEFNQFKKDISVTQNPIEKAAKFYFLSMNSFSGKSKHFCFSDKNKTQLYFKVAENLDSVRKRIQNVLIENQSWDQILRKYDSAKTLFYLDPPYVRDTRIDKNAYSFEMKNSEHEDLVTQVLKLKGKTIISGYNNKIYDRLLSNGFFKREFEVDVPSRMTKQVAKSIEVLWLSNHFNIFEKRRLIFFKQEV